MPISKLAAACGLILTLVGCAGPPARTQATGTFVAPTSPSAAEPYGPTRIVRSFDDRFDGEMLGTPLADGKFSRLAIGMTMEEVTAMIGGPDQRTSNETGKRWIPFYWGNDARRIQVLYRGEGCLTYTGGNRLGGGGNELIRITATALVTCTD